jgi:hypothetical protein
MALDTGTQAETAGETRRVVGQFASEVDAQGALGRLMDLGITPEQVSLTRVVAEAPPIDDTLPFDPMKSGAATGAALGGIFGALGGWMVSVGAIALPGVGTVEGAGPVGALLTGLGLGVLVGGITGALVGMGIPRTDPNAASQASQSAEGPLYMTLEAPLLLLEKVETALLAGGALEVQGAALPVAASRIRAAQTAQAQVEPESDITPETTSEAIEMADHDSGRNPNTVTGTESAIDPETGALGTGGTPMTTGYGVSGSTIGTGTDAGRIESEEGEARRATPDASAYDRGGRGSEDKPERLEGTEHGKPTTEKYGPEVGERASGEEMPTHGDLYTHSPSYGAEAPSEPDAADTGISRAEQYSTSSPDQPPSYAQADSTQAQESPGTNIPGTEDPRGLGDNTDEPR